MYQNVGQNKAILDSFLLVHVDRCIRRGGHEAEHLPDFVSIVCVVLRRDLVFSIIYTIR